MRTRLVSAIALSLAFALINATDASAQNPARGGKPDSPPGLQNKKKKEAVTPDRAVEVTRLVLEEQGYLLVRVEHVDGARVVYYRRGNNGRGRGRGPVEKMVIRPSPDRIIIEAAPQSVLLQVNIRLGI
jgi:hypothetical protein